MKRTKVYLFGTSFCLLLSFMLSCTNRANPVHQQATPDKGEQAAITIEKMPIVPLYLKRSTDQAWQPFSVGMPEPATVSGFTILGDQVFASTDFHGVFKLQEDTQSWRAMNLGLPVGIDVNCMVTIDQRLVIGSLHQGVFISEDGGQYWYSSGQGLKGVPIRAFYHGRDYLIAGTDSGFYRSVDRGESWEKSFGDMQILGFSANNDKLYAAVQDGAMMSTDAGLSWEYVFRGDALHDIYHDGQFLYAMTLGLGLQKSANDGHSWENIQYGIGPPNLYTFEMQQYDGELYAAQWHGIYHTSTSGQEWGVIENLPDSMAFASFQVVAEGLLAGAAMR